MRIMPYYECKLYTSPSFHDAIYKYLKKLSPETVLTLSLDLKAQRTVHFLSTLLTIDIFYVVTPHTSQ